ncbi:MAG: molecular chaperone DnaJ [Ilumatobacteraceae bacterium]
MADFYELLGVPRTASADELKRAYRRLARELHPDANPGDTAAEERFKQVARAYEVLSDPEQRARYDRFGEAGVGASSGGENFDAGGFGDIFEAFFGGGGPFGSTRGPAGPPRGQDLEVVAEVSFEEAVFGATVSARVRTALRCVDCKGSGASFGTDPVTCSECQGRGQVQRVRQSMLGQMVTSSACPRCGGYGQVIVTPCPTCAAEGRTVTEHTYDVDVPAGVDTGTTLRLTGRGAVGPRGGAAGDLYVHMRVRPHERFRREGDDLVTDLEISFPQAALGASFTLSTLDGDEEMIVPPGTQPGREFVLRQRGVPRLQGRGRGDLRVRVVVRVPTRLSEQETELLKALAAANGDELLADQGLFARIKSAFQ